MSRILRVVALTTMCIILSAHVGSPDAWYEGSAGPYRITVQVQMPGVVPGVAEVFVRVPGETVDRVTILGNKFDATGGAPPPEETARDDSDPALYRGKLWLMAGGSNSITVEVSGPKGSGKAVVPVVNVALRRLTFDPKLGLGLSAVGLFLFVGLVTIIGAAVRESTLPPGDNPSPKNRSRARYAMIGTTTVLALLLFGGWKWWNSEDVRFERTLYKPLASKAVTATDVYAEKLIFTIEDSAWRHRNDTVWLNRHRGNSWTPLIDDHGKLMHLFLIRDDMNAFAHFHPETPDSVLFRITLPPLPKGHYRVFADIVHESGYAQTMVTSVNLDRDVVPAPAGAFNADDSWLVGSAAKGMSATLADGSTMQWARTNAPIVAGREAGLRFQILDADGNPAALEPYMGMAGHAVVARDDGSVFVHLHPSGTISMASQMAFEMRQPGDTVRGELAKRLNAAEHAALSKGGTVGNVVAFPYAFPKDGNYRVWVQVKKEGRILTGAFDVKVGAGVKSAD